MVIFYKIVVYYYDILVFEYMDGIDGSFCIGVWDDIEGIVIRNGIKGDLI